VESRDRLLALLEATATLNGIDFVEVVEDTPFDLRIHFLNTIALNGLVTAATIDGGDSVPRVEIAPIAAADWSSDGEGRPLLTLHPLSGGDFSDYRLTLTSSKLDRYFSVSTFSFKVFCPSDFDCAPRSIDCPPEDVAPPPIDYLAKDFLSFRRALSDFSALRYPDWRERSEADFGVMFMEALAALADDLSYQQDRIAAEATLETATQRRSVIQHARLVDYQPRPATSARTWLVCTVTGPALPAGIRVEAATPDGGSVPFEIGLGLADTTSYVVDTRWNAGIEPHWWDDSERCLSCGATAMWLKGDKYGFYAGQPLLIDTEAKTPADPALRQIIHVTAIEEDVDHVFGPTPVTRIAWSPSEALRREHDLTRTCVRGNLVPATQGRRYRESIAIGRPPGFAPQMPVTFARLGANAAPQTPTHDIRYCLPNAPLAWLAPDDPDRPPRPEISLVESVIPPREWKFMPRLIDAAEEEPVFGLEPARYRRIARHADGGAQVEYDGDDGETIKFGNGTFGALPNAQDVFQLDYRVGAGILGNVAADSITIVDPAWHNLLTGVTNPFPAIGGADPETNEQVRRRAPQAFRAWQFRAVLAQDYEAQVERLPWVQQAGTAFRWTGSWFTAFTAVDPKGGTSLPPDQHTEVIHLLNRRRLAGYESYVPPPRYVSIDLDIVVCAKAEAFQGVVERDVLEALLPPIVRHAPAGFFLADRFTFGTPLERSRLETAIQNVAGVAGVLSIRYRRRGFTPNLVELPSVMTLAIDEILRIDNDPDHPERGSLRLAVKGGR
jgi:hypothetical protein